MVLHIDGGSFIWTWVHLIIAPLVHNCKASKILNWLYKNIIYLFIYLLKSDYFYFIILKNDISSVTILQLPRNIS